jgi:hypothetical protein
MLYVRESVNERNATTAVVIDQYGNANKQIGSDQSLLAGST